jgi:hypothetical protein
VRADARDASGITISTPRGEVSVMDPVVFRSRFEIEPPDVSRGARLAAVQFRVHDRAALSAALERGGIAPSLSKGGTIVGPQIALGATLVFDECTLVFEVRIRVCRAVSRTSKTGH